MLITRGLALTRAVAKVLPQQTKNGASKQWQQLRQMSGHPWSYRSGAHPHSKATIYTAELLGGFMWWWVLWHFWHDFDHIVGEFPYPEPSEWTNAELGIPPDNTD